VPFIEEWAFQPVAVPGRLNHGKLLSTLGQLCAFRGEYDEALQHFTAALEQFDQLSDPAQVTRNLRQTNSYKAIVQLDMKAPGAGKTVRGLVDQSSGKKGAASIRKLARSASPLRFEHYLLLRWLTHSPEEAQVRQDYLASIDDWQVGEGHPWMLINAYRGWLLADSNSAAAATGYLQRAVDDCSDSEDSAILHWMAHCLFSLAESLGLEVEPPARICPAAPFPSGELAKLRAASTTEDRTQALNRLLPFNFH
jgi:tetratricopeptide (TPR) repeat protein